MLRKSAAAYFNNVAAKYDEAVAGYAWNGCDRLIEEIGNVAHIWPESKALDFGTGTGLLSESMRTTFKDIYIVGVDISANMIKHQKTKNKEAECVLYDGSRLPFCSSSFDLVSSAGVLEFIPSPAQILLDLIYVTKPGGIIAMTYLSRIDNANVVGLYRTLKEKIFRVAFCSHSNTEVLTHFNKLNCNILSQKEECGLSYPDGRRFYYGTTIAKKL